MLILLSGLRSRYFSHPMGDVHQLPPRFTRPSFVWLASASVSVCPSDTPDILEPALLVRDKFKSIWLTSSDIKRSLRALKVFLETSFV
jgi:hypothetical protein